MIKASLSRQAEIIADNPEAFDKAPRVGRHGWVRVQLNKVKVADVRPLLQEAWASVAPRT